MIPRARARVIISLRGGRRRCRDTINIYVIRAFYTGWPLRAVRVATRSSGPATAIKVLFFNGSDDNPFEFSRSPREQRSTIIIVVVIAAAVVVVVVIVVMIIPGVRP